MADTISRSRRMVHEEPVALNRPLAKLGLPAHLVSCRRARGEGRFWCLAGLGPSLDASLSGSCEA